MRFIGTLLLCGAVSYGTTAFLNGNFRMLAAAVLLTIFYVSVRVDEFRGLIERSGSAPKGDAVASSPK